MKKRPLYKETPAYETFEIVEGILKMGKLPLSEQDKFRLKSEALAFQSTLLFKLITTKVANDMQKEIVENASGEDLKYYRAVLADRRILEEEILTLSRSQVKIPTQKVDTQKPPTVNYM